MKKNTAKNLVKTAKTQTITKQEKTPMKKQASKPAQKTTTKPVAKKEVKAPELEKKELKIIIKNGAVPSDIKLSENKTVTTEERTAKTEEITADWLEWYANYCDKSLQDKVFLRADGKGKIYALPFKQTKCDDDNYYPLEAAAIAANKVEFEGLNNEQAYMATCRQLGIRCVTAWQVIQANYTGAAALLNKLQVLSRELSLLQYKKYKDGDKGTAKELREEAIKAVWNSVARKVSQDYCNGGDAGLKVLKRAWASKAYIAVGKPGEDEKKSK